MTDEQRAELAELNVQIAAAGAENRLGLVSQRARLLSQTDCDLREIARDWSVYLRHRYRSDEWKNQPAWKARAELLDNGHRGWTQTNARDPESTRRNRKAFATAALAYLVEISPELQTGRASTDFDALALLECADKREIDENASLEELRLRALALHVTKGIEAAARAYEFVLRRQIAAGIYPAANSSHVRRARRLQSELYRQLAWWNLVIASAPDEPKWWDQRARCQNGTSAGFVQARRDYERAIALAPDDPRSYEACAKLFIDEDWWDLAPDSWSATATFMRALRLRIAAGQIAGSAARLQEQGDGQIEQIANTASVSPDYRFARAYAFYQLALSADPTDAAPHLKCAQTLEAEPLGNLLSFGMSQPKTAPVVFAHYARALKLDDNLEEARAGVTLYLTRELQGKTGHQRIEALLRARQQLRDFGVAPEITSAILAEVERGLAV